MEMMVPVATANEGVLVDDIPRGQDFEITGDRDQLTQVIQNLVDNSLKYGSGSNDQHSRVHICVGRGPARAFAKAHHSGDSPEQIAVRAGCRTNELVFLRVRDEGRGISSNDLPRLTERFYRTDVEKSHAKGGTGLGLAIVKHIVNRHQGGILVESREGEGAAFTCYFPPFKAIDRAKAG
jgi:two-component system phosphate regulon sensor histidine kinase PhoR